MDKFYFNFNLYTFARISCFVTSLMVVVSVITTALFESNTIRDKYSLLHPLTQTAVIWAPRVNATGVVPHTPGTTCDLYNSSEYSRSGNYVQHVVFEYSEIPSRYLLMGSLLVGFGFQLVTCYDEHMYLKPFLVGNSHITGYLERSICYPLLVVVLSVQVGYSELWSVLGLMFSAWAGMLFSFFAEILFQGDGGFIAIGPGQFIGLRSGDTVRNGGGIWAWSDGNIHYHALSMLFSLANYGFVSAGLLYNFFLTSACFVSQPTVHTRVKGPVYCTVALYAMLLMWQAFMAYMKPKPSAIQRHVEFKMMEWRKGNVWKEGQPFTSDQEAKLKEVLETRVKYALTTEFVNGVIDMFIRGVIVTAFFIFEKD